MRSDRKRRGKDRARSELKGSTDWGAAFLRGCQLLEMQNRRQWMSPMGMSETSGGKPGPCLARKP